MTVNGLRQVIFFNYVSVTEHHCSTVPGEGHSHYWGGDDYREKKTTWVQRKYVSLVFTFSEWHMSPTIQWDILKSTNGYLDFIKPLQLQDLPRVTTVAIIILMA